MNNPPAPMPPGGPGFDLPVEVDPNLPVDNEVILDPMPDDGLDLPVMPEQPIDHGDDGMIDDDLLDDDLLDEDLLDDGVIDDGLGDEPPDVIDAVVIDEQPIDLDDPDVEIQDPPVDLVDPPVEVVDPPIEVVDPPVEVVDPELDPNAEVYEQLKALGIDVATVQTMTQLTDADQVAAYLLDHGVDASVVEVSIETLFDVEVIIVPGGVTTTPVNPEPPTNPTPVTPVVPGTPGGQTTTTPELPAATGGQTTTTPEVPGVPGGQTTTTPDVPGATAPEAPSGLQTPSGPEGLGANSEPTGPADPTATGPADAAPTASDPNAPVGGPADLAGPGPGGPGGSPGSAPGAPPAGGAPGAPSGSLPGVPGDIGPAVGGPSDTGPVLDELPTDAQPGGTTVGVVPSDGPSGMPTLPDGSMVGSVDSIDPESGNINMTVDGQPIELTPPEVAEALADDNRAVRIEGASNGLGTGETIALATSAALIIPAGLAKLIARKRSAVAPTSALLPAGSPLPPPTVVS